VGRSFKVEPRGGPSQPSWMAIKTASPKVLELIHPDGRVPRHRYEEVLRAVDELAKTSST
jgi:hypothetical protein